MANDLRRMAEEIVLSYEARLGVIKDVVGDTQRMLEDFRVKREEMSKGLRGALAKSQCLRKTDFDKMMSEILAVQLKREENVKQMLLDFKQEEEQVASKLRKLLGRGDEIKIKDFKKMTAKIKEEQEQRGEEAAHKIGGQLERMQTEVQGMLSMFKEEREKMASEWKNVVANMPNLNNK